jgi:cobalamin-dependent methionine synthase I
LRNHLSGCGEAYLFAATLGTKADFLLERASKIDMSRAVVLQACAAALTESVCDEAERELSAEAAKRGLFLRPRYSPGYGDFSILHQRDLLGILQAQKKIGLAMTQDSMLVPTKSVTAVIGLTAEQTTCHIAKCMGCKSLNCPFRKD